MEKIDLKRILNDIKSARVGIIGDFCLDVYWYINEVESEVSVETNLLTRPIETQKYSMGGAGNVANNLRAMGIDNIDVFGVIGNDPFGYQMKALLEETKVNYEDLIIQKENWSTHVYTKPICKGEEGNRIDFGNFNSIDNKIAEILLDRLRNKLDKLDVVIVNQQVVRGIHQSVFFRKELQKLIDEFPNTCFLLDSRHLGGEYYNVIHKINAYEATTLCGLEYKPDDIISLSETQDAMIKLYAKWKKPIFVTRGSRGCLVCDEDGVYVIPGLHIIGKLDTVGAGDSMLAGIAACMAKGYSPQTAATFGNYVAGVTVQKLYITGTASPEEILKIGEDPDFVFRIEKSDDLRMAEYYKGSEIEIISEIPINLNVSHVIFDHDGTISILREGWEDIMQPMMIKAILGEQYDTASETVYHRAEQRTKNFINETTGIQTLKQMQGLVGIVKEFGFVPEPEILDEFGYKEIYNEELLKVVSGRIDKLKRNELNVEDFLIKGCLDFMHYLHGRGIKLYLASGTDESDVIAEAKAMGYADLFKDRIFGAVGDVTKEAKRIVMSRILDNVGYENGSNIIAIGDGPVEIREIKKCGGIGIGIASDEVRRFGLNLAKRTRLIRAGADLIIPDYSQREKLYELLKI